MNESVETRIVRDVLDGDDSLDLATPGFGHGFFPECIDVALTEDVLRLAGENQPRPLGQLIFELAGPQPEWPM